MENHHLQQTVGSGQEGTHDSLEELLALLVTLLGRELKVELLEKVGRLLLLEVHDSREDLEDGVQDELVEGTLKLLALMGSLGSPLLGGRVEVVVTLVSLDQSEALEAFRKENPKKKKKFTQRRSIILFLSTPNFLA
jgi:hypothetical protein